MLKNKPLVRRNKVSRSSTKIVDHCNDDTPQYFQVTVNILEGRKLSWANPRSATSYVIVIVDNKKKQRTSVRRNMEEPFYRESFVFEMFVSVREIQHTSLWMAVMESRYCAPPRLLGEANVDLAAVWAQPHHTVAHKWAQLTLPKDAEAGPVGFLKVDISIQLKGEVYVMPPVTADDKIEDNLLLPSGSEQQRASYQITVFRAYGLTGGPNCCKDKNVKPPSTFVRVTFCDMVAKTAVQNRNSNPMYSEQISMVEMFPNLCQILKFEVCSAETSSNRVITSTHLRLSQISHGGENGFLPTFGPSLLHMYGSWSSGPLIIGEDGPYHRGAMLVALKTVVPYYKHSLKTVNVEPVAPLSPESHWILDDFIIYCTLFEVSMLDKKASGKSGGVAITMGEMPSDHESDEEFTGLMQKIRQNKLYYTGSMEVKTSSAYGFLEFPSDFPVLQLATRWPDFRFRMYSNNMIREIVVSLESDLNKIEHRLQTHDYESLSDLMGQLQRSMDDAAAEILKFLDIVQFSNSCQEKRHCITELDIKQMQLQKEEMEKIYQRISRKAKLGSGMSLLSYGRYISDSEEGRKKGIKLLLAEGRTVAQDLKSLIFKMSNGWPDIVIWLLINGSRVAYTKLPAADVLHSVIPEQKGRDCGQIRTLYLKPVKCLKHFNVESSCDCIAAKIELLCWLGPYRNRGVFNSCLPSGHKLRIEDHCHIVECSPPLLVECRVNVYRAKLNDRNDSTNNAIFVRVNFMCANRDTKAQINSVNPVWNEVIRICQNAVTTPERLLAFPPEVLVEVYDWIDGKNELLGRLRIEPMVDDRQYLVPPLQWLDILRGVEQVGQILLSAQLFQLPEQVLKTTFYCPAQDSLNVPGATELELPSEDPEPIPKNLLPYPETYKVDVYWWGLRDISFTHKPCVVLEMDELTVKSGIISNATANCNFPNGKTSQVFEGNLDFHCSPLSVKLYDSGTFGRTLFLGLNIVKNPLKYMISWIPQNERAESLYSTSIMSTAFVQVSHMVFVKKSTNTYTEESEDTSSYISNSKSAQKKSKMSMIRKVFSNKETDEEKCTLLPLFSKKNDRIELVKKGVGDEKDWWMLYTASQTDNMHDGKICGGRFIIYDSELESQSGFFRFKDWCSTFKIYNGKKTGIPEKDKQLHCGYLKVGIAIYKWPPPGNTVAVNASGVELDRGHFDNLPDNDPATFLVRVYVVKAFGLVSKDFAGKSDPYVAVQCGRKVLGERNSYVSKSDSPVFGKMFELRCTLPEDYLLKVSVLNYNNVMPDDIIGYTLIDLEDRVYSKHRACVGLAAEYNVSGQSKWRDNQKPSEILEDLCLKNHIPPPQFPDAYSVVVNGVEYRDSAFKKNGGYIEKRENLCLNLLHKWETLPICGYQLVPEHVETRTLYDPDKPEFEQGKIHLWVDMFALDTGVNIPAAVDITPRHVEEFELRVTVWDVLGVQLKGASDIYVKAWIGPSDEAQDTDIHYRSTDGEGSFNWRMIFHFLYQHSERKLVLHDRGPFTEVEEHFPPILIVQVQDSEATPEEYLGTLMLDLTAMPRGAKLARHCTPNILDQRKVNLFVVRSTRAWWPLRALDRNTGNYYPAGMIDLEVTLLPKEKAAQMPAGLGRAPPSPLPYPTRTKTSELFLKPLWEIICQQKKAVVACVVALALMVYVTQWLLNYFLLDTDIEFRDRTYDDDDIGITKIINLKKK